MSSVFRSISMFGLIATTLAACGGKVLSDSSQDPTTSSIPSSATSPFDPNFPPEGPEDGEWGTWQLLSVEDSSGKRQYDPPFIELDLQPNGTAYFWSCINGGPTGQGERCAAPYRQTCHRGTITVVGTTWRVQLTDREGERTVGSGDITEEASGDIGIDGTGILMAGAHYRRVGAATREGCMP